VDIVQGNEIPRVEQNAESSPEVSYPNGFTVSEDMNAGCLAYALHNPIEFLGLHDKKTWHKLSASNFSRSSLPEHLCWHVLRSISRILLWLHHGSEEIKGAKGDFAT